MSDVFSSKRERKPSEMAICIIDCQYLLPKRASLQFNPYAVVFLSGHVGDIHVVSGWGQIFELLAGEDVDGDDVDLGVTVLSSLGGRHVNDLAWSALDDDVSVLSESRTLHRVGLRGAGIGSVDGEVCLYITSCQWCFLQFERRPNCDRNGTCSRFSANDSDNLRSICGREEN